MTARYSLHLFVGIPYPYRFSGGCLDGRGGFVTRPVFNSKEMPGNRSSIVDRFLPSGQGGLQTRPYADDNTNKQDERGDTQRIPAAILDWPKVWCYGRANIQEAEGK